jgi:SpoIID/LytB domain protein
MARPISALIAALACLLPPGLPAATPVAVVGAVGMAGVAAGTVTAIVVAEPESALAADGRPSVVIDGRGWGHGRGMSQYGALGYATEHGWSSAQILDHYYGGTTAGQPPIPGVVDPRQVRVDLVYMRNRSTTVSLAQGAIVLRSADGTELRRVVGAVRLTMSNGSARVQVADGCNGPWRSEPSIDRSLIRIEAVGAPEAAEHNGLLQVCGPSYRTWYDGEIWATATSRGQRTLNVVPVAGYLRGVVPNEVPASWAAAALEAQAVAARSYVLAGDHRWDGYADTCDTITCQVYDGRYSTRRSGSFSSTHPRTDAAIAATTDVVRLNDDGTVARTEFASSSGGYTAGGDFPAVVDEGDSISLNRNATWRVTVDLDGLERSYGLGAIESLVVTERNGLGADGGRAETVEFRFARGTVTETADAVRRRFGLKSNWFRFGPLLRDGQPVGPDPEPSDPEDEATARFVDRAFNRLAGRNPSAEEQQRWRAEALAGRRLALTEQLAYSEHFAGVMIDELYTTALGRQADDGGRRYWIEVMADGLKYEHLGTLFYGSPEYVQRSGATSGSFVASLYAGILGREPDDGGKAYWVGLLDGGQAAPADVANAFYRSVESRRGRARTVYQRVFDRAATDAEAERGAESLLFMDDLRLAAELATELGAEESNQ